LEQIQDQQVRSEPKTRLVERINAYLRSGDYSRAVDLVRTSAADFPGDAELSELEKLAQDGLKRKADADRLITESQELFAERKYSEAIQLLRQAYELDKKNSLARSILANALVEHAQSIVETDWLESEKLTNQALALNPAHPTAKTILNRIVQQKEKSSADDWFSQASKLQSSGDLFGALAWVAEGLAVHPHDAKLLQIQDAIQRDHIAAVAFRFKAKPAVPCSDIEHAFAAQVLRNRIACVAFFLDFERHVSVDDGAVREFEAVIPAFFG